MHAITHTNKTRVNERALVVSDSSVYSVSYQKLTTAQYKAREKGRKRENFWEREKKSVRERAEGAYSSWTKISFFPIAIYKNIYRRSFDCVGSELMLCKNEHFRFISMVTFHGTKMLLPWNIKTNQSHFYLLEIQINYLNIDLSMKTGRNTVSSVPKRLHF